MNNSRIEQLKKYIEDEPNDPFNIYALANEYLSLQPELALEYFEELLKNHPDYLSTYYQAGKLYYSFGNLNKAKIVFQQGISLAIKQNKAKTLNELRGALNEILDEDL